MCVPVGCKKPVMAVLVYEIDGAVLAEVAEILRVCNQKVSGNRRIHCVVTVKQGSE